MAQSPTTAMTAVGYGLAQQNLLATEGLVLVASLFILIGFLTIWLLVSCLTKSVTSAAILAVADLIISLEATALATSLTN